MAVRPGGADPRDIDAAVSALVETTSIEELQDVVQQHRVIQTPIFHAFLRQEHLRLVNEKSEQLSGFENLYDALFYILHSSAYSRQTKAEGNWKARDIQTPYEPEFFASVRRALGNAFPSDGPALQCDTNRTELEAELEQLGGELSELSAYEPIPGVSWSLLCVRCSSCAHDYLSTRTFAVDIMASTVIAPLLLEGRINNDACPQCRDVRRSIRRVWLFEPPVLHDSMLYLTCAWRMARDLYIFQPPPGMQRDEECDRILEIRFNTLLRSLNWPPPADDDDAEVIATRMGVAYSLEELTSHLDGQTTAGDLPATMMTYIEELLRKTKTGLLPLHDLQTAILDKLSDLTKTWPLVHPGHPSAAHDRHEYLIRALIAESVAAAQGEAPSKQAIIAAASASGFLHLSELGLGEAALARASDHLAKLNPDDPSYEIASTAVTDIRHDFLRQAGRMEEADQAREQLALFPFDDSLAARYAQVGFESNEALKLYDTGDLAAALSAFPICLSKHQALIEEAEASSDEGDRQFASTIRGSLSGDLCNLAAVLTDIARSIRAFKVLVLPAQEEEKQRRYYELDVDPNVAAQTVEAVRPVLRQSHGSNYNERILEDEATRLLEEALEISEAVSSWEFAGVQAGRLMLLLRQRGDTDRALKVAKQAVQFAARASDLRRLSSAHAFLGQELLLQGQSLQALESFEHAAEDLMREQVRRGVYLKQDLTWIALAEESLKASQKAGAPARGILVAESLKAATTVSSLVRMTPFAVYDDQPSESTARLEEISRELETQRLQEIWSPDDENLRKTIKETKQTYDALKHEIGIRDPRFASWADCTEIRLSDLQSVRQRLALLGLRTTFIGFITNGPELWTYAIWSEDVLLERTSSKALAAASSDSVAAITDQSLHADAGRAILDALQARLGALQQDDHLVISPGPYYAHFPWAALRFQDEPLCQRFQISVVPGIGALEACLDRPQPTGGSLLALGGPRRPGVADLPFARTEAESICEIYRNAGQKAECLIGPRATAAALLQKASQFSLVHIACHGEAAESESEWSRLQLGPDVASGDSGVLGEDRVISELRLLPGCTVNLAGCSTARQIAREGPLLGGLVPAFLVAGARSVLGSLCPIADEHSLEFQKRFYLEMARGAGVAEGLAKTQRACLNGDLGKAMSAVEAWAPYVVYGGG